MGIEPRAAACSRSGLSDFSERCINAERGSLLQEQPQFCRLDGFCAAFEQYSSQFIGSIGAELGFARIEFASLGLQAFERIDCAGFGPGHILSFRWPLVPSDLHIIRATRL